MSDYISLKLPNHVVNVFLPPMTTTAQTIYTYDERITEDGETRLTEDGETRILDGFDITTYPEIVAVKLRSNVLNVSVP